MPRKTVLRLVLWLFFSTLAVCLLGCSGNAKKKELADIYLQLGVRYLNLNKLESSKENLKKAVEQEPDNAQAHNALGYLYERIERHQEAKEHYQKSLDLMPDDISIQNNFGRFLCERSEFDQGTELLKQALANLLNDRAWIAMTNLGLCQLGMGNSQKAKTYFKDALQLNPSYAPALLEMQKFSYQSGDHWAAKGYLQRYLEQASHTPGTLWIAIQTEQALGNPHLAGEYRKELLDKFPSSPEAKKIRAQP